SREHPLVIVTGTGTEIGKTHVSVALVRAWAEALRSQGSPSRVAGLKPVESGGTADIAGLEQASTFHVKRDRVPYMLARPVSPHLAAREAGVVIDPARIAAFVTAVRDEADA